MPASYSQNLSIPASSELEASRKVAHLLTIAQLDPDSLAIIARAAKKPGAANKLKTYQNLL